MRLGLLLDMACDGFGDRVVIGSRDGGLTPEALRRRAIGAAAHLRRIGTDAVVYLGANGPLFPMTMFAAGQAGVPMIPLNYRLGTGQLADLLGHHEKALVVADAAQRSRLADLGRSSLSFDEWDEVARSGADHNPGDAEGGGAQENDHDVAALIYTSGSTSTPKAVVLRHSHIVSYVLGTVEFAGAGPTEAAMISVPPYHIAAVANALSNLYAGRRSVVLEQFDPAQWLSTARREAITHALVVPTMLARILDAPADALALPSLRTLSYGGAAMPAPVISRALHAWPDVDFVNAYGLTETSSTIAVLGPDDHRRALESSNPAVRARLSSAGRAVPGVEVSIRDLDGQSTAVGVRGRIWVRGPQVSGEYRGAGSVLDADGWFDTRDQGWLDAEGYLFVSGRTDDTIIRGGENIAPAEIEDVLLDHPEVDDVVVVGVPDVEWGQRIEAGVALKRGARVDGELLRDYVRERLRGSKTPDRIVVWDDVPRNDLGKLVRRDALARLTS